MKHLYSLVMFFLLANISIAQDSCNTSCDNLKHGLQFQVTNLLNLTNFRGYTFSYRYLINKNSGLRFGLTANYGSEDEDTNVKENNLEYKNPTKRNDLGFKFSSQYLINIMYYNSFTFLIGGGPFISFYNSELEYSLPREDNGFEYQSKDKSFSYGIDFIVSVEYKLAKNVVISGETGLYIEKENRDFERYEKSIYEDESLNQITEFQGTFKYVSLSNVPVSLGISVFF